MTPPPLYIGWWYDVMHSWHRDFIKRALSCYSAKIKEGVSGIIIGLNSDTFLNNKKWLERPFFEFDWRKNDMEAYLKTLNISEIWVVDEEDANLSDYQVVVMEWWPMEVEWKDKYDLLAVPEVWWQHTSTIMSSIDDAKQKSRCKMIQIWSILVRQGDIIWEWHNGAAWTDNCLKERVFYSPENELWKNNMSIGVECNSPHAEIMAMKNAVIWDDLITSLSPCVNCAREIIKRGIRRVVYLGEYYNQDPGIKVLEDAGVEIRQAWLKKIS
jgi:deoxycytidylate deaminase